MIALEHLSYFGLTKVLFKFNFITRYWILNELIWQEALLIDFLQKKITDNWVKKFLIFSAYLFNEKWVFDKIIKFFIISTLQPWQNFFFFDTNNLNVLLYFTFVFFFFSFYFLLIFFFFFWMF